MTATAQPRESAYTPGPWYYDGGWQIVEQARPHMRVAFLPSDREPDQPPGNNGHVLAAAPELLEAAIELSDVAGEGSEDLPDDTAVRVSIGSRTVITYYLRDFRALNAAIAKAMGRT